MSSLLVVESAQFVTRLQRIRNNTCYVDLIKPMSDSKILVHEFGGIKKAREIQFEYFHAQEAIERQKLGTSGMLKIDNSWNLFYILDDHDRSGLSVAAIVWQKGSWNMFMVSIDQKTTDWPTGTRVFKWH